LHRLFSAFPAGFPGATLLLLRVFVGLLASLGGGACLARPEPPPLVAALASGVLLVAGPLLFVGFCAPYLGMVLAAIGLSAALAWPPLAMLATASKLADFEFVALAGVLASLGPGAYSLDAQLFGRRELSIRSTRQPDEVSE
jgi:putative oxidoreductase